MPHSPKSSRSLLIVLGSFVTICSLVFTIWIIHEANIGRDNFLFKTVRATPYGDKIGHVLLAGLLTLVVNFLTRGRCLKLAVARIPWGSLIVLVLVIGEELSQYYLPTRSLDLYDALANFLGIFLCSLPFVYYDRKRDTRSLQSNP